MDNGGSKAVLYELKNRDVSHFNPNGTAPDSLHTEKMIEAGAHPLAQILKTRLQMNDEPFIYDIVSTMNVYETLKNNHELNRANINKVAECLEFIGGIKREQVPVKARFNMEADDHTVGKGPRRMGRSNLYIMRNHERYIKMTNAELGKVFDEGMPKPPPFATDEPDYSIEDRTVEEELY